MTSGPLDPRLSNPPHPLDPEPLSAESRALAWAIGIAFAGFLGFAWWASTLAPAGLTTGQARAALGCPEPAPGEVLVVTVSIQHGRETHTCSTYRGRAKSAAQPGAQP